MVNRGEWAPDALYDAMTAFDGDVNGDGKLDPSVDIGELCRFGNFTGAFLSFPTAVGGYGIVSTHESAEPAIESAIEEFLAMVDKIDEQR